MNKQVFIRASFWESPGMEWVAAGGVLQVMQRCVQKANNSKLNIVIPVMTYCSVEHVSTVLTLPVPLLPLLLPLLLSPFVHASVSTWLLMSDVYVIIDLHFKLLTLFFLSNWHEGIWLRSYMWLGLQSSCIEQRSLNTWNQCVNGEGVIETPGRLVSPGRHTCLWICLCYEMKKIWVFWGDNTGQHCS